MKSPLIVATCLSFLIPSATAFAQQNGVTERVYSSSGLAPSRIVERRSESGGRQLIVETEEFVGPDGRWIPVEEIVTETGRDGNGTVRTRRNVFGFDGDRRRVLRETTDATVEPSINGIARSVENTFAVDINGGLGLASRRIEERNTVDSDIRQTTTTLLTRDADGFLRETERTAQTERQVEPSLVRHDAARSIRDANGRWMPIAARNADVRSMGPTERVEEETIQRLDINGRLTPSQRVVTRRSESNGQEQVIIETYSDAEGLARTPAGFSLSERIRRSTTATADGSSTVEEVEARSRVAPGDPMQVVRRTVITVRAAGPNRQSTERQVFERDVNGRLTLVLRDTEEAAK